MPQMARFFGLFGLFGVRCRRVDGCLGVKRSLVRIQSPRPDSPRASVSAGALCVGAPARNRPSLEQRRRPLGWHGHDLTGRQFPSQVRRPSAASEVPEIVFGTGTCRRNWLGSGVPESFCRLVTAHPTAQWTAQQIVEAFPFDMAPRFLLRDRDALSRRAAPSVHAGRVTNGMVRLRPRRQGLSAPNAE